MNHFNSQWLCWTLVCFIVLSADVRAQRTTGSIRGTVTEPSGAVVAGARITATDEATGNTRVTASRSDGTFEIIELLPSKYTVTVEAHGFRTFRVEHLVVIVAGVTPVTAKLTVGEAHEEVTVVAASGAQVETVSTEVGGVINTQEIEQLAIVGRNVMDLAQLEPAVQLRDGGDLDPTKNNTTAVSIEGRGGRETQVQWDGLSVWDPSVGGTVVNIGLDSVQEFQVAEATLNPAQSVASGGAINIVSRRGGNVLHGSGFGFFRDKRFAAEEGPVTTPYDRYQTGGHVGGAIVKDRAFFFLDAERTNTRDSFFADPPLFPSLQGYYGKPFKDNFLDGRIDWNVSKGLTMFARQSYGWNQGVTGTPSLGNTNLAGFTNKDTNNISAIGATLVSGSHWTHDWRYGHVAYSEGLIGDPSLPLPTDSLGRGYGVEIDSGAALTMGAPWLADQYVKVRLNEAKYDAGWVRGHHTLTFGADLYHSTTAIFDPIGAEGPVLNSFSTLGAGSNPFTYPLVYVLFGNRQGYGWETPGLGFPHGNVDNWIPAGFIHDTWSLAHHINLNYGLRYTYMSGIVNPDIKRSPLLNQFAPGFGNNTTTPKKNFAPQLGVAWDPSKKGDGKTVIRAAGGLYYENLSTDSFYEDSASFIPSSIALAIGFLSPGLGLNDPRTGVPFPSGDPLATSFGYPNGTSASVLAPLFYQPINSVATPVNNLVALFQAASALNALNPSAPSLFDIYHEISWSTLGTAAFTPNPRTPRVAQFNIGMQRQLRPGLIFTAEYVKVRGMDFPVIVDFNHVGNASAADFDPNAAVAAISATNASLNCPASASAAAINCAILAGAKISSYGAYGLGAGPAFQGFAFRGKNPNFGYMDYLDPIGNTYYNAMNLRLEGRSGPVNKRGFTWMKANNLSFTYALSRLTGTIRPFAFTEQADQTLNTLAWDNNNPEGSQFRGPMGLDRTHMFNISTITEIKGGFRFSQITHLFTAFPQNTLIPTGLADCEGGPEEIFCSDVTGDGTTGDLLPTAGGPGQYGRGLKGASGLNKAITAYNNQFAGNLTPSGQLLVSQGLFTTMQLQQLGAVMPNLPPAPTDQARLSPLLLTDIRIAYHHKLGERVEVEPSLDVFNIFNRTGYDAPANVLSSVLNGALGSINGTPSDQRTNFIQRGSGTFEMGARRVLQAGIRLTF
jgi:hypothetical protein